MAEEEKIKSAEKVRKELKDSYENEPEDWYVFVGRDSESFSNSIFLHNEDLWIIKEFPVNPFKFIGIGIKKELERNEFINKKNKKNLFSFGFRPLNSEELEKILNRTYEIRKILEKPPLSLKECSSFSDVLIMEGPILAYDKPIFTSKAQEELDVKLRRSLRKLIYRKYPDVMKSYV